jgi:hypothetical protein
MSGSRRTADASSGAPGGVAENDDMLDVFRQTPSPERAAGVELTA